MNAQIDNNRQGMEHVIGPYGKAQWISENGKQLLTFCNMNSLCIGNTNYAHNNIHKKT